MAAMLAFNDQADLRLTYVLLRGEYDWRGQGVGRDAPSFLPPLLTDAPRNRLGLAHWRVAPAHR